MGIFERLRKNRNDAPEGGDAVPPEDFAGYVRPILRRGGKYEDAVRDIAQIAEDWSVNGDEYDAVVERELRDLEAEQETWPHPTETERFLAAYSAVDSKAILALVGFACCGTCGNAEGYDLASEKGKRGYVFFHEQDLERAIEGGGLYFGFGAVIDAHGMSKDEADAKYEADSVAVARELVSALDAAGFEVDWDGTFGRRPFVNVPWQVRLEGIPARA